ncbi:MAG: NAD(P)H-dependent oxidoreductase [bacterium]
MNSIIQALKRRYATKQFNPNKKVSQEDLTTLLESLRLAPSSLGMQPRRFIHVKNPEIKVKLQEATYGQAQVIQASDLIIIASKIHIQEKDIDEYIQDIIKTRSTPETTEEEKKGFEVFKERLIQSILGKSEEDLKKWSQKQAYIAMGVLLTTCALLEIDACPMEGFEPAKYNEILGLDPEFTTTLVIPIGYRAENDKYARLAKVRFPLEQLFIEK